MLLKGCCYQIFSSDDPFASVGIEQPTFFKEVLKLKARAFDPKDFIEKSVELILQPGNSRMALTEDLMSVFVGFLRTADMKEMAIEHCESRFQIEKNQPPMAKKNGKYSSFDSSSDYYHEERLDDLVTLHFFCCASLSEFDRGVNFYKENASKYPDKEIQLYCLLKLLGRFGEKNLWLREYEDAVGRGVKPRDNLVEAYQELKSKEAFPKNYGSRPIVFDLEDWALDVNL